MEQGQERGDGRPSSSFELVLFVATFLREYDQGSEFEIESDLDGVQLDLFDRRSQHAIECKGYTKKVGLRSMRPWASTVEYLRSRKRIKIATMVATSGFTPNALDLAERHEIHALTLEELFARFAPQDSPEKWFRSNWAGSVSPPKPSGKLRAFVVMPFTKQMDDVYVFGIRAVAEKLNMVVHRADDWEHNADIIDEIRSAIRDYDVIIGDTTGANANVCYEIGYAHALKKPTILVCRKGEKLPFDLQGVNHVMYPNIIGLIPKLERRVKSTLKV